MTLEAHFFLSVSCKCAGKQVSPMNWCGFKYFVFLVLKGVYIAWYSSFSSGDTLPGNVGPREENTSNSNFAPREEDTSQCK